MPEKQLRWSRPFQAKFKTGPNLFLSFQSDKKQMIVSKGFKQLQASF